MAASSSRAARDNTQPDDAAPEDAAPGGGDALVDATRPCLVMADADAVETTPVGGAGGSDRMAVRCPDGMVAVGLGPQESDGATLNGAPSTYGFTLVCAHVEVVSGTIVATAEVARTGEGCCG